MIRHVKHKSLKSYFNFKKYGNSKIKLLSFRKNTRKIKNLEKS